MYTAVPKVLFIYSIILLSKVENMRFTVFNQSTKNENFIIFLIFLICLHSLQISSSDKR